MTRIWLVSDLHLEDLDHASWDPGASPDFDVLVCAGDVVQSDPVACVDVAARLAGGRPAFLVLGNHDAWDLDIAEAVRAAKARNPSVVVLDGEAATACGLTFAGGTLWDDPDSWPAGLPRIGATPGTPSGEPLLVRDGDATRRATLGDLAAEHARTVSAIADAAPDVVLTHYPPSPADLRRVPAPTVWLHGHIHAIQVDRVGGHHLVRMPARRDINLVGALVEVSRGRPATVGPVVGMPTWRDAG